MSESKTANIAIIGASGYTGVELVRLLSEHPYVTISYLAGESQAGKPAAEIYPHLAALALPDIVKTFDIDWQKVDIAFCCLPHATSQQVIKSIPEHVKIIDLSADFRLANIATYEEWYGKHHAPELQKQAVYGLTEWARDEVKKTRLVANPGCYPTASQLPLIPLLKEKLIESEDIIIDAKSGVTGAGRSVKQGLLFTEVEGGMKAYGIGKHRHTPEIEQGLSDAWGSDVKVSFTPHLIPMKRGILATIYVKLAGGATLEKLQNALHSAYVNEPFVTVMPVGSEVATHMAYGSNQCFISCHADRREGRAIITSAIDNLVKGASGQAVQNMNVMIGWPETLGLPRLAVFP